MAFGCSQVLRQRQLEKLRRDQERPLCIKEFISSSASEVREKLDGPEAPNFYTETVVGVLEEELEKFKLDADIASSIDEVDKKKRVDSDSTALQNLAAKVKQYLKCEGNSTIALFNYPGFDKFLVKILEDASKNSSLQFNAAWILGEVLKNGSNSLIKRIIDPDTLAVPSIVKFLQSSDKTIYEKAVSVIALLAKEDMARTQLIDDRTAPSLFVRLEFFMKKGKKISDDFVKDVSDLITELVLNLTYMRKRFGKKGESYKLRKLDDGVYGLMVDVKDGHPPSRTTKLALPIISALLSLDNISGEIRRRMMECLATATTVLEDVKPLIENDCCSKIVSIFNKENPPPGELLCAVSCIGNISVTCGRESLLRFLKNVKNVRGLEYYWKGVRLDDDDPEDILVDTVIVFLDVLADVIHWDFTGEGSNAAIDSGIIDSLVHFLTDPDMPMQAAHISIGIIHCMLSHLNAKTRDAVGHCLVPVLGHLIQYRKCKFSGSCISIMLKFIEENAVLRDEAMSYGALPTLLEILGRSNLVSESEKCDLILRCILCMVSVTPLVSSIFFEDVPNEIKKYLGNVPSASVKSVEIALEVLVKITANYGSKGTAFVVKSDLIPCLVTYASVCELETTSGNSNLQKIGINSMTVLTNICTYGSAEDRKQLISKGILEVFENVLKSNCIIRRELALTCLDLFLDKKTNKLTGQQRVEIKNLAPLLPPIINSNAVGILIISKTVYSKMMKVKDLKGSQ